MTRRAQNLLIAFSGIVFTLLALELALRLAGVSWPIFYAADRRIGPVLRPGAEGWFTAEGRAYVRISSGGLRDREHERRKAPGVFRIAVLGDSYAEAMQLPAEDTFWAVLERELSRTPPAGGKQVEVINFGVSGYGTAQALLMLRHRVWAYDPDLVLLAVTTGNDIRNNSKALEGDPAIPYFRLRDGVLVPDDGYLSTWRYRAPWNRLQAVGASLSDHSRIIQLLNRAKNIHSARKSAARQAAAAGANGAAPAALPGAGVAPRVPSPVKSAEAGLDAMVFRPPGDPAWQDAWAVTEALIAQIDREVRGRGARFLLATLSSGIQVHPDPAVRDASAAQLGVPDLDYPDRRLAAFCRAAGIPAVSLAPGLAREATERKRFLHGFGPSPGYGHWNADGHRLAGERIAEAVKVLFGQGPAAN